MSKPRPAPWIFDVVSGCVLDSDGHFVIDIDESLAIDDDDSRDSVGRLISAAPELLECLRVVSANDWVDLSISDQDKWLRKSAAAIAKVEGRS